MTSLPTAAVLIIGNEILSGRTADANLNYIAKKLSAIGIKLCEARVVADIEDEIVAAVNALRTLYTYVFSTGGIGPTHDDITADSMGAAFGVGVEENPAARARLAAYYGETGLTTGRLRMARMPVDAVLIDNPVTIAPGFRIGNVYVMAGVPSIMQAMMDSVAAELQGGAAFISRSVSGYVGESVIAEGLAVIAKNFPDLDIGSYPWSRNGRWGTALVARGTDKVVVDAAMQEIHALMQQHDPAAIIE